MRKNLQMAVMLVGTLFASNNSNAQLVTQTFSYTGAVQTLTVPNCVTNMTVTVVGAKGANGLTPGAIGGGYTSSNGGTGGLGASVSGVYTFTSAPSTLNIYVGGVGTGSVGGFNGGGNGYNTTNAGAGGGASDVRLNGLGLTNRIVVAGGGGGGGNSGCSSLATTTINGGNGGGGGGGNGTNGVNSQAGGGGFGGAGSTGGAAGIGCSFAAGNAGGSGVSGIGGAGGMGPNVCQTYVCGGGGGGGFVGGGAGGGGTAGTTSCTLNDQGGGGGGAGGTSYTAGLTGSSSTNGVNNGNGYVTISYSIGVPPTITVSNGTICSSQSFTINPSGASTYSYSSGSAIVSPTANTTYTVIGSSSPGCTNTAVVSVYASVCPPAEALNFDGANDRIDLGNGITTSLSGGTAVSVEAWVKPTSLTGLGCIVSNYSTGSAALQILLRRSGNSYYEFWVGNGGTWYPTNSVATPTLNVWQHIAATWNGTVASIYVNGVLSGTTTPAISTLGNASNSPVWIGANTINENFTGNIDEVRIWNVARTQCDINTYKNCEIPTTASGLLANYHFNQGLDAGTNTAVNTLTDASGNTNTGALTNFTLSGSSSNWVALGGVVSGSVTPANLNITVGSTVSNSVICSGNSTTLSGTGADTYNWTSGVTNATAFSPTVTATYTVTGTNTLTGCSNTAANTVTVNTLPTIAVNSGSICAGQSFTMVPSGAATYTYSSGTAVVTPTVNASYNITGTDANGCISSSAAVSSIMVNALPTITVSSGTICSGASYTIIANGALTYTSVPSLAGPVVTPTVTTNYSITGTDANGCVNSNVAVSSVTVNALPTISVNSSSICVGQSFTMTPSGATTYTYSSGSAVVTPTTNSSYSITGTSAQGCVSSNTAISTVTVNALPTVSATSGAICSGKSFTMTPNGASTYTYSSGSAIVSPTANASYSVTGTSAQGCVSSNTAVSSITVNALPMVMAATNSTLLCVGNSATLTASGATSYTWNTTATTAVIAVSPTTTVTYTVNGTGANGCSNAATVTQSVSACVGINELAANDLSISVYPNPTNGLFILELNTTSQVSVTNALGEVVITETLNAGKHNLDIHNEAIGVYFVKVIENNKQQVIKLIKQ